MVKKAFTLVEVVIVMVVAVGLLAVTFNIGGDYLTSLRFKQDRETYINELDEALVRARTTNYYRGEKYTYIDVLLDTSNLTVVYGTGNVANESTCGTGTLIRSIDFERSVLSGDGMTLPYVIRLEPYKLGCNVHCGPGAQGSTGNFASVSTISDNESCFSFDANLCKLSQIICE